MFCFTDLAGIHKLQALLGQSFSFLGGPALSKILSGDRIVFVCDKSAISFNCNFIDADLEGFPDEYNIVRPEEPRLVDIEKAKQRGYFYTQLAGEQVKEISIVEETVTRYRGSEQLWSFVSDVAFIFEMAGGFVAISKLSHHMEMLKVTYGNSLDSLVIPETSNRFEEDIFLSLEVNRRTISLSEAIDRL